MTTIDLTSAEKLVDSVEQSDRIIKLIGTLTLESVSKLQRVAIKELDLTEVIYGIEEERWATCMGYSHCGPVYGNSGIRDVDVLQRMLETVHADKVILPDDVARRHLNAIKRNNNIYAVEVKEGCKLFSMKDGNLFNKKGTLLQYTQRRKDKEQ